MAEVEKAKLWGCPECRTVWHSEAAALSCCSAVEEDTKYQCDRCESEYEDPNAARKCCCSDIEVRVSCPGCGSYFYGEDGDSVVLQAQMCCAEINEISVYKCPECGSEHDESQEADICCREGTEVKGWRCTGCGTTTDILAEAKECCG